MTYLKYLDTLRVSESFRSVWIFAESSYKIFEYAKKRVYRFVTSSGVNVSEQSKSSKGKKRKLKGDDDKEQGKPNYQFCFVILFKNITFSVLLKTLVLFSYVDVGGTSTTSVVLDEVLEEAPKWKVLRVSE